MATIAAPRESNFHVQEDLRDIATDLGDEGISKKLSRKG
jgi:hypothetical protein